MRYPAMKYNPEIHHRQSIRLRGYDYSQPGAYFVTICTYKKQCWFGEVRDGKMYRNQIGNLVAQEWLKSPQIRDNVKLDAWVVMPNHLHGIVWLIESNHKGASEEGTIVEGANGEGANGEGASVAPLRGK